MTDQRSGGIEWTDHTWNPLRGCSRVSAGCVNCYAENVAHRFGGPGLPYEGLTHPTTGAWNGTIKLVPEKLNDPLRWKRPRRIFVNSMSDLFHERVPETYIREVFAVMALAHWHTFQVLTKRPERMLEILTRAQADPHWLAKGAETMINRGYVQNVNFGLLQLPLPNVWLGTSVENQAAAAERIPLLLETPARVRWISAEPLVGPVYARDLIRRLDWVVVGGESGSSAGEARVMDPEWVRSLLSDCELSGVPFLLKQWGDWVTREQSQDGLDSGTTKMVGDTQYIRVGKKAAGRLLDGRTHDGYPHA